MKAYIGKRSHTDGVAVYVMKGGESEPMPLPWRTDVVSHSPTGLDWGYGGSGPAQLALALLIDVRGNIPEAKARYQQFKWDVIAKLPYERWRLTEEQINLLAGFPAGEKTQVNLPDLEDWKEQIGGPGS